jgi:dephospho-CoA kinase
MIIGLTGNYGMGKSSVLSMFRELGAAVLDSDEMVRELLCEKEVIRKISEILGERVENNDGTLDKAAVAEMIFNSLELRKKIEAFLHPMVLDRVDREVRKLKGKKRLVIVEVPLLFEGEYQCRFDRTITVYATQKEAVERLARAGVSRRNALKRMKVQMPISLKKKKADYLIDNGKTKQHARKQVEKLYRKLINESKQSAEYKRKPVTEILVNCKKNLRPVEKE